MDGSEFWQRHVRTGLTISAAGIAMAGAYLAATPGGPNRPALWGALGGAVVLTATVGLLPWQRLVTGRWRMPLLYTWSALTIPLIVLATWLDGGHASPVGALLILPVVFASMAYPPRVVVLIGAATALAELAAAAWFGAAGVGVSVLRVGLIGLIAMMGAAIARNHVRRVAELERVTERLETAAHVDELTGTLNRRAFQVEMRRALARAQRDGSEVTLLLADLDHFKRVNDLHGHPAGDALLVTVAQVLADELRAGDVLARLGGEEFAALLPDTPLLEGRQVAERLRAVVERVDEPTSVTTSIGVATYPAMAASATALIEAADRGLYVAKREGRNRVVVDRSRWDYVPDGGVTQHHVLAQLLGGGRLTTVFQPIVDLATGSVVAHEALSRVDGEDDTVAGWLAVADEVGCRAELEAAMWRVALATWRQVGHPEVALFLNASPDALNTEVMWDLRHELPRTAVIEVSERFAVRSYLEFAAVLRRWSDAGVRFAIDDVGAGHANLRHVVEIEPSFVKLDRSIVAGLATNRGRAKLVAALAGFAGAADITVIAEGVETADDAMALARAGVPLGQGYGLARPAPIPPSVTWRAPADHDLDALRP